METTFVLSFVKHDNNNTTTTLLSSKCGTWLTATIFAFLHLFFFFVFISFGVSDPTRRATPKRQRQQRGGSSGGRLQVIFDGTGSTLVAFLAFCGLVIFSQQEYQS